MKKLFAILAVAGVFAACGGSKTETPAVDSSAIKVDSTAKVDSTKKDSSVVKVDSTAKKDSTVKK